MHDAQAQECLFKESLIPANPCTFKVCVLCTTLVPGASANPGMSLQGKFLPTCCKAARLCLQEKLPLEHLTKNIVSNRHTC